MKKVERFQCEVCNEIYEHETCAIDCENKGKELPLVKIGDMIEYKVKVGGGFDPYYVEMRVSNIEDKGHYLAYYFEEYDEHDDEWCISNYCLGGIWGNNHFRELCRII